MIKLYQVKLPYAVFAIEATNDIVIGAAPIAMWMVDKSIKEIKEWVTKKQGTIDEISQHI